MNCPLVQEAIEIQAQKDALNVRLVSLQTALKVGTVKASDPGMADNLIDVTEESFELFMAERDLRARMGRCLANKIALAMLSDPLHQMALLVKVA